MDYVILAITLGGACYAYGFARWLRQQGNITGTIGVAIIVAASVALPVYRIIIKRLS